MLTLTEKQTALFVRLCGASTMGNMTPTGDVVRDASDRTVLTALVKKGLIYTGKDGETGDPVYLVTSEGNDLYLTMFPDATEDVTVSEDVATDPDAVPVISEDTISDPQISDLSDDASPVPSGWDAIEPDDASPVVSEESDASDPVDVPSVPSVSPVASDWSDWTEVDTSVDDATGTEGLSDPQISDPSDDASPVPVPSVSPVRSVFDMLGPVSSFLSLPAPSPSQVASSRGPLPVVSEDQTSDPFGWMFGDASPQSVPDPVPADPFAWMFDGPTNRLGSVLVPPSAQGWKLPTSGTSRATGLRRIPVIDDQPDRDPCVDCGTVRGGTNNGVIRRTAGRCLSCYNKFRRPQTAKATAPQSVPVQSPNYGTAVVDA